MDSVTICNLALMLVGIPPITSFEDENNNAKLCKAYFPVLRDRVLRDHSWSFALAGCDLQVLAEESVDPSYDYVCGLPGDLIRVIEIVGNRPYRRIGDRILVREVPARLLYTRREEDCNMYDETFVEALQYLLAAEIGMSNTRSGTKIAYYRQEYERRLSLARSIDSQENRHALQGIGQRSKWLAARGHSLEHRTERSVWVHGTAGIQE